MNYQYIFIVFIIGLFINQFLLEYLYELFLVTATISFIILVYYLAFSAVVFFTSYAIFVTSVLLLFVYIIDNLPIQNNGDNKFTLLNCTI
jgi:hypothetical protein